MRYYFALAVALTVALAPLARSATPSYSAFSTSDFAVAPNSVAVSSAITRNLSPHLLGLTQIDYVLAGFSALLAYPLGTLAPGATVALLPTSNYYVVTNAGSYTITLPVGMPDCTIYIDGTSTSAVDPAVVTLPNAAIRVEKSDQVPVDSFTIATGTLGKYTAALTLVGAVVDRFSVAGDNFTPATPAASVTFVPLGDLSATTVQAALAELDAEKTTATLITTPEIDIGTNTTARAINASVLRSAIDTWAPTVSAYLVHASGTAYTLTATPAAVDFGTQDPVLILPAPGNYIIGGKVDLLYNGATFAANRTVTLKFRRTNNTAADLPGSSFTLTTDITTTKTENFASAPMADVGYTTALSTDSLTIFADVSVAPSAGALTITGATLTAYKVNQVSTIDAAAPTITLITVAADGVTTTFEASEPVSFGAGGSGGFTLTMSGGATTFTYVSGTGSSTITGTSSRTILAGETGTGGYTQPANGWEDFSGTDLATFSGTAVVNSSAQTSFSAYIAGVTNSAYMTTPGTPAAFVDGKAFTFSGWIKPWAGNGARQDYVYQAGNGSFYISRSTANKVRVFANNTTGSPRLDLLTTGTLSTTNGWTHLYVAVDVTGADTNNVRIYLSGTNQTFVASTFADSVLDLSSAGGMRFGAGNGGTNNANATFSEFWLANGYVDIPSSFRSAANRPISLGVNGELPTGTPPAFYYSLNGSGTAWSADSSGNGNSASVTGTFTSADTPP